MMSKQGGSPVANEWKRPSGVIKLKVKKRRTLETCSKSNVLRPLNSTKENDGHVTAVKRRNPFGCPPQKRPNLRKETVDEEHNRLFQALSERTEAATCSASKENDYKSEQKKMRIASMSFEQQTTSSVPPDTDDIEETEEVAGSSNTIPLDWSLKTKVRFTSSQSFSWVSSLKSSELAEGISDFVRCEPKEFDDLDENMDFNQARTLLHKICRSWAHPFLPWLKLFPRSNNNEKALAEPRQTNTQSNVFVDESLASSLQADWVNSFHSVFNLLRCGNCPYFFMCANQCTMLFRAAGISSDDVDAVITPTTKGLREALKNEGIDFTLPHLSTPTHGEPSTSSSDSEDEATSDCDDEDDASDGGEWLESMGLGKEQFPTYEPNKLTTTQTAKIRTTDQNPASTVYVRGQDTRALFNFILNWRSIVPKNGQLAGVPPTLLAPVAFEGATLRSLKVNQGTVKHQQSKGLQQLFSLEITGPLMPSVVHDICCLIKSTQEGSYQAAFVPQQNSVAINFVSQPSVTGSRALASHKLGISETNCKYFSQEQTLNKASLKELTCKNGKFSWKQTS